MNIAPIKSLAKLEVEPAYPDFRRDLHTFMAYVSQREVKRGHRDNAIGKTDARRLVKLLGDPDAEDCLEQLGYSNWLDTVDRVAVELGLVHYDTQGTYQGYTSREPSFPDNYIEFDKPAYDAFLSLNTAAQEQRLLNTLIATGQGSASEFYGPQFGYSRLNGFSSWGSATAVVPMLDFTAIRKYLLNLLATLPTGQWLSTASLVEYLKNADPYFLIPKKPGFKNKYDEAKGRYSNFRESTQGTWSHEIEIKETDADAFERVEGRYVERFLEGLPRFLGYVDVAYGPPKQKKLFPALGTLHAFRISERLQRVLTGTLAEPTLRVTPSFDVYLQSELYPAREILALRRFCEHVTQDTTNVFRLDRQRVATACAEDPKLNVLAVLESLSTDPLPPNVRRELDDWAAHSNKFVLYLGCSLLETNQPDAELSKFQVENVSPGVNLVHSADRVFAELEKQGLAPLRIKHAPGSLSSVPDKARSVFPSQAKAKKQRKTKTKVTLMRVTNVQLLCPDEPFLERLQRLLADASCPVEADRKRLALSYSQQYESNVTKAIKTLKNEYEVKISDR